MTRRKMRDRFPAEAINLRCSCGKRFGLFWLLTGASSTRVDGAFTVPHELGRRYQNATLPDGSKEVRIVNDDDDSWFHCPQCDARWGQPRSHLVALYNEARRNRENYATMRRLTPDLVERLAPGIQDRPSLRRRESPPPR